MTRCSRHDPGSPARAAEVEEARIFGSRALGTARSNSDVDVAVWGRVTASVLGKILLALDELPLPYKFDVIAFESLGRPELKAHIESAGKPLYRRGN
ncbi:MAG: nucleotidyltransferase domain-containing protein [Candidatus Hydrogenedentes bacterium]|nr:nucleotidyltransferase domain-containing protein [Candidatus Hydrogenedentota bacterium]